LDDLVGNLADEDDVNVPPADMPELLEPEEIPLIEQGYQFRQIGVFRIRPIVYRVPRLDSYRATNPILETHSGVRKWSCKKISHTIEGIHTLDNGSYHVEWPIALTDKIHRYFDMSPYQYLRSEYGPLLMDFSAHLPAPLTILFHGTIIPVKHQTFESMLKQCEERLKFQMPEWGTLPWTDLYHWEYYHAIISSYLWTNFDSQYPTQDAVSSIAAIRQISRKLVSLDPRRHSTLNCFSKGQCLLCTMEIKGTSAFYSLRDEEFYPMLDVLIKINIQYRAIARMCLTSIRSGVVRIKIGYKLFNTDSFEFVLDEVTSVVKRFPKTVKQRELARIYCQHFLGHEVRAAGGKVYIDGVPSIKALKAVIGINTNLNPWLCERIKNAALNEEFDARPLREVVVYNKSLSRDAHSAWCLDGPYVC